MSVKLADAERMVQAAQRKAREMGLQVVISVVDQRGDWITLSRMDGAPYRSIAISKGKAFAAAEYGVPSAKLTERADNPVLRALMIAERGLFVPQQGALPIRQGDQVVGAIGVSGATSPEDETIALAGLEAL